MTPIDWYLLGSCGLDIHTKDGDTVPKSSITGENTCLAKVALAVSAVAALLTIALLLSIFLRPNFALWQGRPVAREILVEAPVCREIEKAGTPLGVAEEYTFLVDESLTRDTHLAFYTVHQYVDVYIDGEHIYSLKPSEAQQVKTIGSNWSILPIYREDAGKEVRVEIIPVYESFRDREVQFLLGSQLEIYVARLKKDLPQLILAVVAISVGFVFLSTAIYNLFRKHRSEGLISLGLVSVVIGLNRLSDTRFSPFLLGDKPIFLFYITACSMMIGLMVLIHSMRHRFNPVSSRLLDLLGIGAGAVCIGLLLLQVFGGVDLRQSYPVIHITLLIGIAVLAGNTIYERLKYPQNQDNLLSGKASLLLAAGLLADFVTFYRMGNSSQLVFTLLAMLLFILLSGSKMIAHYFKQEKLLAEQYKILAETERKLTESRIETMISQIRPHFIYNTLGSVEQLCELQPELAASLVHEFSCYLRGNLDEMDNPAPIPLSRELEHVRHYVRIEQVRFPDMEVEFDIHCDDFLIPALTIQPLVENAIKHGLMKLPQGGTVRVSTYETTTHYCVRVDDNGVGFDPGAPMDSGKHVGLKNARGRIETMCRGTLTVESAPGMGTHVLISIPKEAKV